jgi:DNA repair protein RadC
LASVDRLVSIDAAFDVSGGSVWPKSCVSGPWRGARAVGIFATVDTVTRDKPFVDSHLAPYEEQWSTEDQAGLDQVTEVQAGEDQEILAAFIAPIVRDQAGRISNDLIRRFGTLPQVFAAFDDDAQAPFLPNIIANHLRVSKSLISRLLRREIVDTPLLSTSDDLLDYLHNDMAQLTRETMRVFFLDANNQLMHEQAMWEGTLAAVQFHPREIVRLALRYHSSALILVHNHPSGNATPSASDIQMTHELCLAARYLGIVVHDHIIISSSGHVSMYAEGLMDVRCCLNQNQTEGALPRRMELPRKIPKLLTSIKWACIRWARFGRAGLRLAGLR